jgi:hypothetical protein
VTLWLLLQIGGGGGDSLYGCGCRWRLPVGVGGERVRMRNLLCGG